MISTLFATLAKIVLFFLVLSFLLFHTNNNIRSHTECLKESSDLTYNPSSTGSESDEYRYAKDAYWTRMQTIVDPSLTSTSAQWMIGDVNLSLILMDYCESCIQKAENDKMTNASELLSLGHIFLFEEDAKAGLREVFDGKLFRKFFNETNTEFVSEKLSDNDVLRCNKMSRSATGAYKSCKPLLREWQNKLEGEQLQQSTLWKLSNPHEDTFVHNYLAPLSTQHYL